MTEKSKYELLASIDVSKHIEKKNGLSYLSWAWAVDQLLRADPTATWAYNEAKDFNGTMMVSCTVIAFGKPITMHLPVMDYRNKAIPNPDAFQVNTAMMRCLVKAIACHGLGLYIYAGEDLPLEEQTPAIDIPKVVMTDKNKVIADLATYVTDCLASGEDLEALRAYRTGLGMEGYHHEEQKALYAFLDTPGRRKLNALAQANPPEKE